MVGGLIHDHEIFSLLIRKTQLPFVLLVLAWLMSQKKEILALFCQVLEVVGTDFFY